MTYIEDVKDVLEYKKFSDGNSSIRLKYINDTEDGLAIWHCDYRYRAGDQEFIGICGFLRVCTHPKIALFRCSAFGGMSKLDHVHLSNMTSMLFDDVENLPYSPSLFDLTLSAIQGEPLHHSRIDRVWKLK